MQHLVKNALLTFAVTWVTVLSGAASGQLVSNSDNDTDKDTGKHVRLLTVGNSFTRNATRFLNDLASAGGHQLTHEALIVGGSPLKLHVDKAMAFQRDPNDPKGRYSNKKSLQEALGGGDWDYVTIQQVSIKSHDLETYRPFAGQLAEIIHQHAPQAQLLVHQTWAYRKDDPRFSNSSDDPAEPTNQHDMYRGLSEAYRSITRELGARRIPVGDAFYLADSDPHHGYRIDLEFDAGTAAYPSLPDQTHSLHVGWRWVQRDGEWKLGLDGHHANVAGEYLGACVWYEVLFGETVVGNRFVPEGIDSHYAEFLQHTAHRAVAATEESPQKTVPTPLQFDDSQPQRYQLQARASLVDPRTKEYPEIDFVFEKDGKPMDLQTASVDTRVKPQGKLVIWLMGDNEALFERLNEYGLHAIQVSYARQWFGRLCRPQPKDGQARGNVRLEAATGEDFSDELNLAKPDGMSERAFQFVKWLNTNHPQGRWDHFLNEDQSGLRWDRVIVAGSSHGSTTAARFAIHQRVDRVVMLCGPRDQDQQWQSLPSATPAKAFFGFSHVLDGGWTGDHYCRSWEMLGLHRFGPIVNVDENEPPYQNTRRLISAADVAGDANRAHSSVTPGRSSPKDAAGKFQFEPVWRYLFNHPVDDVGEPVSEDPECEKS